MNVVENICPVCQHKNEVEAVVCGNCGSTLDDPFLDPGAKTKTTDMEAVSIDKIGEWTVDEATIPQRGIAIYIEGQLEPSHVDLKDEFVIGRKVDATSDVSFDLSPAGGYHLGISRRHAVVRHLHHDRVRARPLRFGWRPTH